MVSTLSLYVAADSELMDVWTHPITFSSVNSAYSVKGSLELTAIPEQPWTTPWYLPLNPLRHPLYTEYNIRLPISFWVCIHLDYCPCISDCHFNVLFVTSNTPTEQGCCHYDTSRYILWDNRPYCSFLQRYRPDCSFSPRSPRRAQLRWVYISWRGKHSTRWSKFPSVTGDLERDTFNN